MSERFAGIPPRRRQGVIPDPANHIVKQCRQNGLGIRYKMKKILLKALAAVLILAIVPYYLSGPVTAVLQAGSVAYESAYAISFCFTAVFLILFANRKRIMAHRRQSREKRAERRERNRIRNSYVMNLSPYEYEEYVAEEMRQDGFTDVDTTPKSGDYGADVLARDGDRLVCVQCKHYAPGHPVGVKAVQEIYSAKDYYGCDDAYIYTTSDYTKAAVEMANQLGVVLVRTQI